MTLRQRSPEQPGVPRRDWACSSFERGIGPVWVPVLCQSMVIQQEKRTCSPTESLNVWESYLRNGDGISWRTSSNT